MNYFTFLCLETDNGSGMEISLLQFTFFQGYRNTAIRFFRLYIIRERSLISKRLIKLNNEIILEVGRNTTTVTGSIAHDFVFSGNHLDRRTTIKSIHHYI
jgi:hypothetical protein